MPQFDDCGLGGGLGLLGCRVDRHACHGTEFLDHLHARLRLAGLAGLGLEAVDELHHLGFLRLLLFPNVLSEFFAKGIKLGIGNAALFDLLTERSKKFFNGRSDQCILQETSCVRRNVFAACFSSLSKELFGESVHEKFAELKTLSAERCPKALGSRVKKAEIQFHHEVTNQFLWNQF